jgi:hypothetical protein
MKGRIMQYDFPALEVASDSKHELSMMIPRLFRPTGIIVFPARSDAILLSFLVCGKEQIVSSFQVSLLPTLDMKQADFDTCPPGGTLTLSFIGGSKAERMCFAVRGITKDI